MLQFNLNVQPTLEEDKEEESSSGEEMLIKNENVYLTC